MGANNSISMYNEARPERLEAVKRGEIGPWKYIAEAAAWARSGGNKGTEPNKGTGPKKESTPKYTGTTMNNSVLTGTGGDASTAAVKRKKLMGSSLLGE